MLLRYSPILSAQPSLQAHERLLQIATLLHCGMIKRNSASYCHRSTVTSQGGACQRQRMAAKSRQAVLTG